MAILIKVDGESEELDAAIQDFATFIAEQQVAMQQLVARIEALEAELLSQ